MLKKERIGEGTYSIVYKAIHNGHNYAVKRNLVEKDLDFISSLREMDILNKLKKHPYVISLECVMTEPFPLSPRRNSDKNAETSGDLKDDNLHFVFPLAEEDLTSTSEIKDVRKLTRYMVDILLAIEFMHSKDIIHRDLKPQNILIVEGDIKICDFGLSKPYSYQGPNSPRVVTSWYRAPELILAREYDFSIDIWSLGCIFFEMVAKRPFISDVRDNNRELMRKIKSSLPNDDDDFHGETWFNQLFEGEEQPFLADHEEFIDLLSNMLNYYPEKRFTATQCLNHVFFRSHIKHINETRRNFPPVSNEYHKIKVVNCNERIWAFEIAAEIFNRKTEYAWYDHRIIFQALDMFDRYLLFLDKSKKKSNDENGGLFLSKYEARLTLLVTLYMSLKYFTGMVYPVSFKSIVGNLYRNSEAYDKACLIETYLIRKVFNEEIYRPTVYDIIKEKMDEKAVKSLLIVVSSIQELNQDMRVNELASLFLESIK